MRNKLTREERRWVLYDVGNSAFTLMVSTIFPLYFYSLSEDAGISSADYLAYWGYAASIATVLTALGGPIFGTLADGRGRKKKIFTVSVLIGAAAGVFLGFTTRWFTFLVVFIAAKTAYSLSLVFYDSMLTDVTDPSRIDIVSSKGYAWGYIGSCIPFILCLMLILSGDKIGISTGTAMTCAFIITAVWWIGNTLPLLKIYRQRHYVSGESARVSHTFRQLGGTFKEIGRNRQVLLFLLAFFFFIDGVYTIIDMATAYGTALGLDSQGLLLALLVTQFVAFPSALIIGRLSTRYPSSLLIGICIAAYTGIAVFAFFLKTMTQFWILAVLVGMFQGGIQALSRSHYAKLIPAEKSGEYFGIMDVCGKGASFLGTTVVAAVTAATGSANLGVGAIAIFFVLGGIIFLLSVSAGHRANRGRGTNRPEGGMPRASGTAGAGGLPKENNPI